MSISICVRSAVDNATWCRALTEYARACAQAGKPLHGWRMHFQQCGMQMLSYLEILLRSCVLKRVLFILLLLCAYTNFELVYFLVNA